MSPQETRSNYEEFVCNQQLQSLLQGHIFIFNCLFTVQVHLSFKFGSEIYCCIPVLLRWHELWLVSWRDPWMTQLQTMINVVVIYGHSHTNIRNRITNGWHYGSGFLFHFKIKITYNNLYLIMTFTSTVRCFPN